MARPAVLLLALLAALPVAARAEFELEEIHDGPDRPRILLAPRAAATATMVIGFDVGAHDDGPRAGLTRLSQHAVLAANARVDYEALMLDLHAEAATLRVETGLRRSQFVLTAHREAFPALARKLAEAVLAPAVDAARLPRATELLVHEAHRQPVEGWLVGLVAATGLADGRYQADPYGDRTSVETITAGDVRAHLGERLVPANASIVVAGAFDRAALLATLRRFKGGRASPPERESLNLPVESNRPAPRDLLVAAWPIAIRSPRDAAAARAVALLCERELWRTFRDAGTGYGFVVSAVPSPWLDLLVVALPARDRSALDLRPFLRKAIARVKGLQLDDATLERGRAAALARMRRIDGQPEPLALALAAGGEVWHGRATAEALAVADRAAVAEAARRLEPASSVEITFTPRKASRR